MNPWCSCGPGRRTADQGRPESGRGGFGRRAARLRTAAGAGLSAMQPGYRRRILIEPAAGPGEIAGERRVTAELEDDYHRMVVTLTHKDGAIIQVASEMKRSPWTLCPGAMAQLAETFTGVTLADVPKRGQKTANCTHLHDLAIFAASHADESAPVSYDIHVTDAVEGVRRAT